MVAPTLPQTKYAQKLKPYTGEPPSYVETADRFAREAGLTITHLHDQRKHYQHLVLVYAGTKEQITAFALQRDPSETLRWPVGRLHACTVPLLRFSPGRHDDSAYLFKITDDTYALQIKIDCQDEMSTIGRGVECFTFDRGLSDEALAYVGTKSDLIKLGIASTAIFPDDSTEAGRLTGGLLHEEPVGGFLFELERTVRLYDDRWVYTKYPQATTRAAEAKQNEGLADYSTPDEWLERIEDFVCAVIKPALGKDRVKTRGGFEFIADPAEFAAVRAQIEAVAQRIRTIPVKVRRLSDDSASREIDRERAAAAGHDPKFQRFLQVAFSSASAKRDRGEK